MTDQDLTAPEAVERLTQDAAESARYMRNNMTILLQRRIKAAEIHEKQSATLRALSAERGALEAENARLRDERDNAIDTLNAWFDRRKLAHEVIDETVLNAARGYLRTSRSGGMDKETSDMIEGVIEDMARLSVFADLFARAALRDMMTEAKGIKHER